MIKVTDLLSSNGTITMNEADFAEKIAPWYAAATGNDTRYAIQSVINQLQDALNRHAYTGDLVAYLGIEIEHIDEQNA